MSNELTVKQNMMPASSPVQQTGEKNLNVTNNEGGTVNVYVNNTYTQGMGDSSAEQMIAIQRFSKEYYQLIVTTDENVFNQGIVEVDASRALTKYNVPSEIF